MGFWIFMLIMDLLIPLSMIGFGRVFIKNGPNEINGVFGYRTSMSMKNKDTWVFAHHYCGKLWLIIGWIMLFASIIPMILLIGRDIDTVGRWGGILCAVQTFFMLITIIPTEVALKRNFDKDGNRKK